MPMLPAFCNSCGTIFSSGYFVENSTDISFSNCTAGPCPSCGGIGHIPDGTYNFINNTIQLLSGTKRSIVELKKLEGILRTAREQRQTAEEIANGVAKELPELSSIKDILPQKRSELYPFISVIISIIMMIITLMASGKNPNITTTEVINYIYESNNNIIYNISNDDAPNIERLYIEKTGRNNQCPCGSGKKYKFCHGSNK